MEEEGESEHKTKTACILCVWYSVSSRRFPSRFFTLCFSFLLQFFSHFFFSSTVKKKKILLFIFCVGADGHLISLLIYQIFFFVLILYWIFEIKCTICIVKKSYNPIASICTAFLCYQINHKSLTASINTLYINWWFLFLCPLILYPQPITLFFFFSYYIINSTIQPITTKLSCNQQT